ncbi:hypothetical protein PUN28_010382 [Cardiocondyla obscurior]|uniref:Uncharacterized protein n=1 Tax=Cardiocondyla obscurior TaxID=286306 RepID=A0AAW2FUE7_9HYME
MKQNETEPWKWIKELFLFLSPLLCFSIRRVQPCSNAPEGIIPKRLLSGMSAQVSFESTRSGVRFAAYPAEIRSAIIFVGDATRGWTRGIYTDRVFTPELQSAATVMRLGVGMGMTDHTAIGRRTLIHPRGRLRRHFHRIAILRGGT